MKPLISIMIPTYNQDKYISKCIESALAIEYENLQVILSDDCSTDNTFSIAKEYESDPRFKAYRCEENLGRVKNYNHMLRNLAKGEWVLNCDGDDYLLKSDFFNKAMDILGNNNNIKMFTANRYRLVDSEASLIPQHSYGKDNELLSGKYCFSNYYNLKNGFHHITTLYNREEALKADFYTVDIISSDMESILRIVPYIDIYHFDDYIAVWRDHEENVSKSIDAEKRAKNLLMINSVYNYHLSKNIMNKEDLDKWQERFYIHRIIRTGNKFLMDFNYKLFFEFINIVKKQKKGVILKAIFNHRLFLTFIFPWRKKLMG